MSTPDTPLPPPRPGITARGLSVAGPDGIAFGPLDLRLPAGGLHVLHGPSGSGRTSLLLTLAGRFKPVAGELDVLGAHEARAIRGISTVAGFRDIDVLDDAVRVRDVLNEQIAWDTQWFRRAPKVDAQSYDRLCGPVFGPRPLPPLDRYISDLAELDRMLLRIALAAFFSPQLLVVDDLEQVRSLPEQAELIDRLIELGQVATVVASAINPLPAAPGLQVHHLPALGSSTTAEEV
ncbi:ATP-binding cassette domain-containing protein [Tomitella biformata]|uniref:ATP-binding cassette domain-containing protein n=1 Tax=Tomitella biformata TaxID=630403 RepID=UPI0004676AB4|nr:ATP-binding cassette domain-containing protein [Tomitella biformata]